MSLRIKILVTVIGAALGVSSCKNAEPAASSVKSQGFSCDLQSSGEASNNASKKAFECAYNSMMAAGELAAGGFVTKIADLASGLKDIYDAAILAPELIADINEFLKTQGKMPSVSMPSVETVAGSVDKAKEQFEKTPQGAAMTRSAMYGCLAGSYDSVRGLSTLLGLANDVQGQTTISSAKIQAISGLGLDSVKFLLARMKTVSECTQWLNGKRSLSLTKLSKGAEKLASSIGAVVAVAQCGVDLAYGGYVLYANSVCLASDIKNYYESRDRLDRQRDRYVNTAIPQQDENYGDRACMAKYGMHLYKAGPGEFYNTPSYMCALYCGNNGRGMNYMLQNMNAIYSIQSDRQYCERVAKGSQDFDNVNICIVYCCDQDGPCRDTAWKKLRANEF